MARPKRHNADYFSHDSGMRDDPKIKALRNKFGITGYAVWCMMLEVLTNSDYFKRQIDDIETEILAADFGIDADLFSEILSYMVRLRLLQTVDNCEFLSQKLCNRLQSVTDKRRNSSKKGVSVTESTQSKVKKSKVNKSKEKLEQKSSAIDLNETIKPKPDSFSKFFEVYPKRFNPMCHYTKNAFFEAVSKADGEDPILVNASMYANYFEKANKPIQYAMKAQEWLETESWQTDWNLELKKHQNQCGKKLSTSGCSDIKPGDVF